MGKPDTVMQSYLSDKSRFADLFNGIFFQGQQVICFRDLQEASERYSNPKGQVTSHFRDMKMLWKDKASEILCRENVRHNRKRPAYADLYLMSVPWGRALGRSGISEGYDGFRSRPGGYP